MDPYRVPQSELAIAKHGSLHLAIIKDCYRGPQSELTIALHRGIYLAITEQLAVTEGPKLPLL
jgi:hypothetical protein